MTLLAPTLPSSTKFGRLFRPAIQDATTVVERQTLFIEDQDTVVLHSRLWVENIATEFKRHERKWKRETRHLSDPAQKYLHPSYARVIGLGWPAVSLILRTLKRQPDDWFYALRAITGANPVTPAMAGDMPLMVRAWIKWGEQRGLV
jgi:hypothetical protein